MPTNIVLVPGLNNTRAVFDGVVAELSPSITALAVDCPPLPTVEEIAQALLPSLPDRFWLAGFSFGGYVSLALLELAAERVLGLAMVCTGPHCDRPERLAQRQRSIETAERGEYLQSVEAGIGQTVHPDSLNNASLLAARRRMVEAYGPDRYIAHSRAALARPDRGNLLRQGLPVLWVGASHDKVFPPELVRACAAEVASSELHLIEDAGHLVPMEKPQEVAGILAAWIGNHSIPVNR